MVKKVLKFGGTSVGTSKRIQHVADIIKRNILEIKLKLLFQQWQEKQMN